MVPRVGYSMTLCSPPLASRQSVDWRSAISDQLLSIVPTACYNPLALAVRRQPRPIRARPPDGVSEWPDRPAGIYYITFLDDFYPPSRPRCRTLRPAAATTIPPNPSPTSPLRRIPLSLPPRTPTCPTGESRPPKADVAAMPFGPQHNEHRTTRTRKHFYTRPLQPLKAFLGRNSCQPDVPSQASCPLPSPGAAKPVIALAQVTGPAVSAALPAPAAPQSRHPPWPLLGATGPWATGRAHRSQLFDNRIAQTYPPPDRGNWPLPMGRAVHSLARHAPAAILPTCPGLCPGRQRLRLPGRRRLPAGTSEPW